MFDYDDDLLFIEYHADAVHPHPRAVAPAKQQAHR
jgi:hypothetical protein